MNTPREARDRPENRLCLLTLPGGGLVFALLDQRWLWALIPENLLRREDVRLDIYGFALLMSMVTGMLFGAAGPDKCRRERSRH